MEDKLFAPKRRDPSFRRGGRLGAPLRALWHAVAERVRGPLRRAFLPRRFQAYCVGLSRSGSHSLAGLFAGPYRSGHEADGGLRDAIHARFDKTADAAGIRSILLERDRLLWLEMDSANMHFFVIEDLVALFPRAKFILTIRHCLPWLRSRLDTHRFWGKNTHWPRLQPARYGLREGHPPEEKELAENNLFTVDGYLKGWAEHNRRILAAVPAERLLIVRTHEIGPRLGEIARFVGAAPAALDGARSHEDPMQTRYGMLERIAGPYLEEKLRRHCGELMGRFFPEFPLLPPADVRL